MGLGVAAGDIRQQLGQHQITGAATDRPLRILLSRSGQRRSKEPACRSVTVYVHEIIVAENADHEIVELIVTAHLYGAKPAIRPGRQVGAESRAENGVEVVMV